jgi:hypothetical protein
MDLKHVKWGGMDLIWLSIGRGECGNETSGSKKCG